MYDSGKVKAMCATIGMFCCAGLTVLQLRGTNAMSFMCHCSIWARYRQKGCVFCIASFGLSSLNFELYLRRRYKVSGSVGVLCHQSPLFVVANGLRYDQTLLGF
jgi:hypothetical protein